MFEKMYFKILLPTVYEKGLNYKEVSARKSFELFRKKIIIAKNLTIL